EHQRVPTLAAVVPRLEPVTQQAFLDKAELARNACTPHVGRINLDVDADEAALLETDARQRSGDLGCKTPYAKSIPRSNRPRKPRRSVTFCSSGCGSWRAHGIHGWMWSRLESIASLSSGASVGS